MSSLFHSPEAGGIPPELSCFLNRCFIARVRCLLDSTSGFLVSALKQTKVHNIAMIIKHGVNVDHFLENLDL